ncbi:unnamed protein product [Cylicostephanus goldi]|uniref:Uncharacterized protein n=1 Tax=Cylicostephanus goldi TaxID=71465 RepID=A0A3P7QTB8_CYLGO|nr:unnamed protein product [Cylicostephanus goldi]
MIYDMGASKTVATLVEYKLINDGTAAALDYGVFRRKDFTEKPQRLMIYDMGASKTVATLVEYKVAKTKNGVKEPKVTVLGVGFDRTLGGLEMTLRLRDLLVKMFKAHYKTQKDITTNERAMAKMLKEAERLKQRLGIAQYKRNKWISYNLLYELLGGCICPFAAEEVISKLHSRPLKKRVVFLGDEFNSLIDGLMKRVTPPVEQALKMAELSMDQVDQFVLMGAGTRVPRVQEELQKFIGSLRCVRLLDVLV